MSELFSPDFLFRNAVYGGWIVCVLCALLGVYVALRRMVLLGLALPQAGAAGIAFVFLVTHHVHGDAGGAHGVALAGSLAATFAALGLLVAGARGSRTPVEWRIGAVLAVASALTLFCVSLNPSGDLEMTSLLRGELLAISDRDLAVLAVTAGLVLVGFVLFRRDLLLVSFDREFARTVGKSPTRWDALLYALLGVGISVGVMTAGPMVVFGFLVLPALAALRVTSRLAATFALAAAIGSVCALGGFEISYRADLPAGPVYVLLAAAIWLAISGVARLRRRRAVARALGLLLAALLLPGCATTRGTVLPPLEGRSVAVLPFRNETGASLRLASPNPLQEVTRALGRASADPPATVLDVLEASAVRELAQRGYRVAPSDFPPVNLVGTLYVFDRPADEPLRVRLELELVDPADGSVLWRGGARRPVPVPAAQTLAEVAQDAAPSIFAEAFAAH
ncbi:MAG TPA: iron chelate uptake ABC transporter family permease subunit [Myxococcota bacterium]|nr:iron chelate uptake ABC transporter family permease subunit [Myxococcota bacterium]